MRCYAREKPGVSILGSSGSVLPPSLSPRFYSCTRDSCFRALPVNVVCALRLVVHLQYLRKHVPLIGQSFSRHCSWTVRDYRHPLPNQLRDWMNLSLLMGSLTCTDNRVWAQFVVEAQQKRTLFEYCLLQGCGEVGLLSTHIEFVIFIFTKLLYSIKCQTELGCRTCFEMDARWSGSHTLLYLLPTPHPMLITITPLQKSDLYKCSKLTIQCETMVSYEDLPVLVKAKDTTTSISK